MHQLFEFHRPRHRRQKKARGAVRRAKLAVERRACALGQLTAQNRCDLWHQHLDWHGLGNLSLKIRRIFLSGYAGLFRELCTQARNATVPYQIWIYLDTQDAGYDAVYVHTPNPNTPFPVEFPAAECEATAIPSDIARLLPEFDLAAFRYGDGVVIYAVGHGHPPAPTRATGH